MEKFYQAISSEMMLYCCMMQLKITSPSTLTFTMVILLYAWGKQFFVCEIDAIVKLKSKCDQINWISETFQRLNFLRNRSLRLLHNCRFPGENRKGLGNSELWSRVNVIA